MNKHQLKQLAEERPLEALAVGAAGVTAIAKLIDAVSAAYGRKAYAKQINHKTKKRK